jgi:hypothetical protein
VAPWDPATQAKRRQSLLKVLAGDLPEDTRKIWLAHLENLAATEQEYNTRVREVYKNHSQEIVK